MARSKHEASPTQRSALRGRGLLAGCGATLNYRILACARTLSEEIPALTCVPSILNVDRGSTEIMAAMNELSVQSCAKHSMHGKVIGFSANTLTKF